MANQRHLSQGEPDLEKENEGVNNIQPSGWGDIGSLFFQGDQNNESKTRQGQHIIEINHDPNTEDDNNDNFINISDTGNSFEYSADENEGSETSFNSPQSSFFKATSTPLSRKTKTNDASRQHQKYIYSNKTINKKKITSSLKQSLNRKSESQAFWKSHLLENQSELDPSKYHLISPDDRISENPSLETIKRSLSQINLNKQRSSYHKRFLSKPSLSISRINSSAYYKRKGNLIKMKLVNFNKESLETSQLRRKSISKSRITKPHTIQHKSSKVHPVKLHKSRIKKEIELAKEAGYKILEKDIMYKYKVSNSKLEGVSSQNPTTAGQSGVQNLLYLQNEEEYNHIMVDYDDKAFNDKQIGFSKDFKSPHTLVSSTSNDIDPGRRRVKTPIDPNEEFKREQREGLRTSGSYSIESLRNHQNGPLILSKLESSGRITHNTNHLKVKGSRYPQKTSKLSSNICAVDGLDSKNISCLSSPYLNKPSDFGNNFNYNYQGEPEKPTKFMNKTETAGFNKVKVSEATKKQIRNQMLDLDLIKLPSIGNEYAHATKPHIKLQNIGTCDTGKNSIPSHQIIQPAAGVPAGVNLQSKDDYKQYFNPMLNKTRIDNLPPLQEMSVLDQSYESKRKQTANQQLRSRSKNYYNLENCNYPSGTMNECKASNNKLEESKSNMPKPYKSPTREHKRLESNNTAIPIGDREVVVDTSISVVSSIGGSGKEILINTANTAMKSSDNCV